MTKSRKILCTLLALWMSAAVVPGQILADDTVPVDFAETEPARDPVADMLPEDLADAGPDAVAPSDTIAAVDGVIASGTCGDNLTWVVDEEWTLTISGEGEMMDYSTADNGYPWNEYIRQNSPYPAKQSGIKKAVLEEGVTSIAKEAFVHKVGKTRYYMDSMLESVVLPSTLTTIQKEAFTYCNKLTEITIPKSVTSIGQCPFLHCDSLENIFVEEGNSTYWDINGVLLSNWILLRMPPKNQTTTLDLSGIVGYMNMFIIDNWAFENCVSLEHIIFPSTPDTAIYTEAFRGCTNLQEVNLPQNLNFLNPDSGCFMDCPNIQRFTISPENASFYTDENGILFTKDMSTLITYPAKSPLTTYTVADTVSALGRGAFSCAASLESVTLPDIITEIGHYTFQNCTGMKSFTVPSTVTNIGSSVFEGCTSLTSIYIPEGVQNIYYSTFKGCSSLTSIHIPETVQNIYSSAFRDCTSLKNIDIPAAVDSIGSSVFQDCVSLTSIHIPESVRNIYSSAFQGCTSLTSIDIPAAVESIGFYAFYRCSSLSSVYFYGDLPAISYKSFGSTAPDLTLYYIEGKSGWTTPTWTDSYGVSYNTATFTPGSVDPDPSIPGDIDGNGVLNYFDVSTLYAAYLSGEVDPATMDVNTDGVVDYFDVAKLYAAFRGTVSLGE